MEEIERAERVALHRDHLRLARAMIALAEQSLALVDPAELSAHPNALCRLAELGMTMANEAQQRLGQLAEDDDPWSVIARELEGTTS